MTTQPYYQHAGITLYQADCLTVMPELEPQSVDAIITDIPYGTTACSWDQVIPFDDMWKNIKRLIKPHGAIVLFGSQPFTSLLIGSNLEWFKYELIWNKGRGFEPQLANVRPMKAHENMCIFCDGKTVYIPQKIALDKPDIRNQAGMTGNRRNGKGQNIISSALLDKTYNDRYPISIVYCDPVPQSERIHSTQKPVELIAWLIRTYTKPGDLVLDFTSGSGTTLEAARSESRRAIGIERDLDDKGNILGYCDYTVERLAQESLFSYAPVEDIAPVTPVDSGQRSIFDLEYEYEAA
jgi:site-specific DNA-methyltransferase (adenine-specific)